MSDEHKTYPYRVEIPPHATDEQINRMLHEARHDLVEGLLEDLHNDRYWLIRIQEHWPPHLSMRREQAHSDPELSVLYPLEYRLTVEVRDVETRRTVVEEIDYSEWPLTQLAIDEIRRRWRIWTRRSWLGRFVRRVRRGLR